MNLSHRSVNRPRPTQTESRDYPSLYPQRGVGRARVFCLSRFAYVKRPVVGHVKRCWSPNLGLEKNRRHNPTERQWGFPWEKLGGADRHNSDYSCVAEKSRCVAGCGHIALTINDLWWSGRRDSNSRPSAPKTGHIVYGSLLKSGENKCF